MKKIAALLLLVSSLSFAQHENCKRMGEWTIPAGGYATSGHVSLIDSAGSLYIKLPSNYSTTVGPDVQLLLSPTATWSANTDYFVVDLAEAGSLFSGEQVFEVPGNVDIDDYAYILMHCVQYNHMWAYSELGTKTGDCDATNGITDLALSAETDLYPNPTSSSFQIETEADITSISLLDATGNLVKSFENGQTYQVSDLEAGIYSVIAQTERGTIYKKLIVE